MNKNLHILICILCIICFYSCASSKNAHQPPRVKEYPVDLVAVDNIKAGVFPNLDYGINVNVVDKRDEEYIFSIKSPRGIANYKPTRLLESYISESVSRVMNQMGFNVYVESNHNYNLNVSILNSPEVDINLALGTVHLRIELLDPTGKNIYSADVNGKARVNPSFLGKSYARLLKNALEQVNWERIAVNLRKPKKPIQEVSAQVQGSGDTALESTIIRWYIQSAPAGADVQWRIVSSTPDVKNTNQNFLGSTPYESTESFDIMGLTYNNSGNVQIEVSCEKTGYITQRKRFNVQSAIDQKEISTKFNLIKED